MPLHGTTTLSFRPTPPHGDRAWIFYTRENGKIFRHVFRDNQGRQMAFSKRNFEDMIPHIKNAEQAMIDHGPGVDADLISTSHIVYNIAAGTFDFITSSAGIRGTGRALVHNELDEIKNITSRMDYYVAEEDPLNRNPPPPRPSHPLAERLSEDTKLKVEDCDIA